MTFDPLTFTVNNYIRDINDIAAADGRTTMFKQINLGASFIDIAREVREYWYKNNIVGDALVNSIGDTPFRFLEGPPTANGKPHLGHAMTRTIKDVVLRYRYMTGHQILGRSGGWDCHGLPVEIAAEKDLGINSKKEIEAMGIDAFNQYCRDSVFRYIDEWREVDSLLGFWVDHNEDYITLRTEYMESEWWALKSFFQRGLLFKDYKIVPYCPRCGTSLSSHEVSQGYEETKDMSIYVKFRVLDEESTYFLAWTTTPWTLPSNQFLAVNPGVEYSLVQHGTERFYLASSIVQKLFGPEDTVISKVQGSDLEGKKYDQLLKFLKPNEGNLMVVGGNFVSLEEGTGIVHISPAFGADDFEIGKQKKTKILNPVSSEGKYSDPLLPWEGLDVMAANGPITDFLKKNGLLFKTEKITHTYPFCWRCKSPLIYYPLDTWFIRVSANRKKIIETNEKINWYPGHLKHGRFGNFLDDAKDWALSRNRYWGTPLPIWKCENNHYTAIGSLTELEEKSGKRPTDLHRPYVDAVEFPCDECGATMHREPYVIDTWFDSGSATYAALGYPRATEHLHIPVDFITEAIDQTRGWYYTLHVISSLLFDTNAYKNVLTIEFVLDENGRKMSKSEGNDVSAKEALDTLGPDPLRLFFLFGVPWKTRNYDIKLINEVSRKSLSTLLNVYNFFAANATLDSFEFSGVRPPEDVLDKWILSRMHSTVKVCRFHMDRYELHEALKRIMDLVEDLSNVYLRLSRRRFWSEGDKKSKYLAYTTLYTVIDTVCKLLAPLVPFTSEYVYRALTGNRSVHLESYPKTTENLIRPSLEKDMYDLLGVLEAARRARQKAEIKGRQPLTELMIQGRSFDPGLLNVISPEINCRDIRFIEENEAPVRVSIRLDYKKAAPKLKADLKLVEGKLQEENPEKLQDALSKSGKITVSNHTLTKDDLITEFTTREGYVREHDSRSGSTLFLNVQIDKELEMEGLAREIVRRIQVMRKEMNLQYDDRIMVWISAEDPIKEAVQKRKEWIASETLSDKIELDKHSDAREWEIDDLRVSIYLEKA